MKITTREIAEYAGVSTATVCRVLNNKGYVKDETRMVVMDAISDLKGEHNNCEGGEFLVGVIVPDIKNPIFLDVIQGIDEVISDEGGQIVIFNTYEDMKTEYKVINSLKRLKLDGIIIGPTNEGENLEFINLLENLKVPIVLIDRELKNSNFDGVFIDDILGGFEATRALLNEGKKRIAIITGNLSVQTATDRLIGYEKALINKGIDIDKSLVFVGDYRYNSGYEKTKEILQLEKVPDSIFVCNNLMLEGTLKALEEEGLKLGEDISVVGFDGLRDDKNLCDSISYIERPTVEMGKISAQKILSKIFSHSGKDDSTSKVVLKPRLILRK